MAKKITYISICVLAGLLTALALIFVGAFNVSWKKSVEYTDNSDTIKLNTTWYQAVTNLQSFDEGQAFLDKFLAAKVDDIGSQSKPGKFYEELTKYANDQKAICDNEEKLAKDFFSYMNMLKSVKQDKFQEFKSNFPHNMLSITVDGAGEEFTFGKEYVNELKKVNSHEEMVTYINEELSPKYIEYKKKQLEKADQLKSIEKLLAMTDEVYKISAYDKAAKTHELETFQERINQYKSGDKSLTISFTNIFILLLIAIVAAAVFIIYTIITRFRDYRIIMVVACIFIVLFAIALFAFAIPSAPQDVMGIKSFVDNSVTVKFATFIDTIVIGTMLCVAGSVIYLLWDLGVVIIYPGIVVMFKRRK